MNRWSVLQGRLNKYSRFVQMVKRNPTSGFSEVDSIGQVNKLYKKDQGHDFKWYDCWLVLKDSSKWYMYTKEQNEKKLKSAQKKEQLVSILMNLKILQILVHREQLLLLLTLRMMRSQLTTHRAYGNDQLDVKLQKTYVDTRVLILRRL